MSVNKDNDVCNLCGRLTEVLFNTLRYCPNCESGQNKKQSGTDLTIVDLDEITIKIDDYLY